VNEREKRLAETEALRAQGEQAATDAARARLRTKRNRKPTPNRSRTLDCARHWAASACLPGE